jgi:putative ABC transport system substrate-binding protein
MPVIGFLEAQTIEARADRLRAFHQGLKDTGYVEGQNVAIEYRSADGHYERLPAIAADLVRRQVAVIAAMGGIRSALAARAATTTTPIIFNTGGDPVQLGLVASLNRPGGNLTGVTGLGNALITKQLQLVRELLPKAGSIGFLINPNNPITKFDTEQLQVAAQAIGLRVAVFNAHEERDFESAFTGVAQAAVGGLIVQLDGLFNARIEQLAALAVRHTIPTIHAWLEFARVGGLISYGPSSSAGFRQIGVYVGRILKGEKPADLPVVQATKFDLVINLKTAKLIGVAFPATLLALADEVIE